MASYPVSFTIEHTGPSSVTRLGQRYELRAHVSNGLDVEHVQVGPTVNGQSVIEGAEKLFDALTSAMRMREKSKP